MSFSWFFFNYGRYNFLALLLDIYPASLIHMHMCILINDSSNISLVQDFEISGAAAISDIVKYHLHQHCGQAVLSSLVLLMTGRSRFKPCHYKPILLKFGLHEDLCKGWLMQCQWYGKISFWCNSTLKSSRNLHSRKQMYIEMPKRTHHLMNHLWYIPTNFRINIMDKYTIPLPEE